MTQTGDGADILIVGHPDPTSLTAALVGALTQYGLVSPTVRIRTVEQLPRHQASGKLRRFIPLG